MTELVQAANRRLPLATYARWLAAAALLAVVTLQASSHFVELSAAHLTFAWQPAVLSLVGLTGALALGCEGWRRILVGLGSRLPYRDAFRMLFLSNLAKYLPGSAWNLVGRVVLARRGNVPAGRASVSVVMEIGYQLVAGCLLALLALPSLSNATIDARVLAALLGLLVLSLHPGFLNVLLTGAGRILRRPMPRLQVDYRFQLRMLGFYTLLWFLFACSFAMLAQALLTTPMSTQQIVALIGAFVISWNLGLLAFVFPAGLGVREASLVLLLGNLFPVGWVAGLALVARVWIVGAELAAFGLAMALREDT